MRQKLGKREGRWCGGRGLQVRRAHEAVIPLHAASIAGVQVECHPEPIRASDGDRRHPEPAALGIDQRQPNIGAACHLGVDHRHPIGFETRLLDPTGYRFELGARVGELLVASEGADSAEHQAAHEAERVDPRIAGRREPPEISGLLAIFTIEAVGEPGYFAAGCLVVGIGPSYDRAHAFRPDRLVSEHPAIGTGALGLDHQQAPAADIRQLPNHGNRHVEAKAHKLTALLLEEREPEVPSSRQARREGTSLHQLPHRRGTIRGSVAPFGRAPRTDRLGSTNGLVDRRRRASDELPVGAGADQQRGDHETCPSSATG
ncbi:MAG: hypothetical protein WHV64_01115 [Geminicoccaceae bacterium]